MTLEFVQKLSYKTINMVNILLTMVEKNIEMKDLIKPTTQNFLALTTD